MNATMNKILKSATITVELATSQYGTLAPTLRVAMPVGSHHRHCSAVLHHLAAELELAISEREVWPVTVQRSSDYRGTIEIELMKGTPAEAERAMGVLRALRTR